jgi:hypothetical protein
MFSNEVIKLFVEAVNLSKQSGELFVKAYEMALVERGGKDWRNTDDPLGLLTEVGHEARRICKEAGMSKGTCSRYLGGAHRSLVFGLPFKFCCNATIEECATALEQAKKMPGGVNEANVTTAVKAVVRQRISRTSVNWLVDRQQATVLPYPAKGDDPATYCQQIANLIAGHFADVRVAAFLRGQSGPAKALRKLKRAVEDVETDPLMVARAG